MLNFLHPIKELLWWYAPTNIEISETYKLKIKQMQETNKMIIQRYQEKLNIKRNMNKMIRQIRKARKQYRKDGTDASLTKLQTLETSCRELYNTYWYD